MLYTIPESTQRHQDEWIKDYKGEGEREGNRLIKRVECWWGGEIKVNSLQKLRGKQRETKEHSVAKKENVPMKLVLRQTGREWELQTGS